MFLQQESRDELGLGQIRDALSDALFPGTSVLLTRARYFLFVPWLFREGARLRYEGARLSSWVDQQERRLIGALRDGGDLDGLIGRNVGVAVQNLPSGIYWNSLRRFGILRHQGTEAQIVGLRQISRPLGEETEFLERSDSVWAPSIPEPPGGFFSLSRCDFALTHDEATWLAERIVNAVPDTLLQFLVAKGNRPEVTARYAWEDPDVAVATGRVRNALDEARRFAVAMHGAALLYNVLLAERAGKLGLLEHEQRRDNYAAQLEEWLREVESSDLGGWDLNQLWTLVTEQERPAAARTLSFVTDWVALTLKRTSHGLADDPHARALIMNREVFQKRGRARLRNDRLMRQWGGASGSARLNFRWPVVARLLDDIARGREGSRARS